MEFRLFNFNDKTVKCYVVNDNPWFRANDVATILEYNDTKKAIANNVDDDEQRNWKRYCILKPRGI